MITAAEVQFCIIDNKPIDESPAYKALKAECGDETADKWTRWEKVDMKGPLLPYKPPEQVE